MIAGSTRTSARANRVSETKSPRPADSLYEAAAQGLRVFRENEWIDEVSGDQTTISVVVRQPRFNTRFAFETLNVGSNRKAGHRPK